MWNLPKNDRRDMMIDFTGFGEGVTGKPLPADSALGAMKKTELIELLHIANHKYRALKSAYGNAIDNSKCNRCPLTKTKGGI